MTFLKKVLVTGANGFLGQHLISALSNRDYEIHVTSMSGVFSSSHQVTIHQTNLLNTEEHTELIKRIAPSYLIHAAWFTKNGHFWDAVENIDWLQATISLAKAFYEHGGKRFLGVGSCAEYNWNKNGSSKELPNTFYGKIKRACFESINKLAQHYQKEFAWGRVFFPFGPGEDRIRLMPYVITSLLSSKVASCSHGRQVRDFLYVTDVADALAAILDNKVSGAVDVGSGKAIELRDVIMTIGKMLNGKELIKFGELDEPQHPIDFAVADIHRLKNEVGWTQKHSLNEGIKKTIDWWAHYETVHLNF